MQPLRSPSSDPTPGARWRARLERLVGAAASSVRPWVAPRIEEALCHGAWRVGRTMGRLLRAAAPDGDPRPMTRAFTRGVHDGSPEPDAPTGQVLRFPRP